MTREERILCECNGACPICDEAGLDECPEPVQEVLYRRDERDDHGTALCEACGESALDSGLYE